MHWARLAPPGVGRYVLRGHKVQAAVRAADAYVPAEHCVQLEEPGGAKVPVGQAAHALTSVVPTEKDAVPAGHNWQEAAEDWPSAPP